jgi:hypothetical protein
VWVYPQAGVTVYFGKDGMVEALTFGPGSKGPPKPTAAQEPPIRGASPAPSTQASGAGK